jgi:hypothetical protein
MDEQEQPTPDDAQRPEVNTPGYVKYFDYPAPDTFAQEEQRRYDEIAAKLPTSKRNKRSRRR